MIEPRRRVHAARPAAPRELAPALVEARAERAPHDPAVVAGAITLTYAELNAAANRLARRLRREGVGPEAVVAACLERSHELAVVFLGVLKAGGAYLPLDPGAPDERLGYLLEDAGAAVVVTDEPLLPRLRAHGATALSLSRERLAIDREGSSNIGVELAPENLAYVIYTSGSTGKPKGVCISHDALSAHCEATIGCYGLTPSDRVLQFTSSSFDQSIEDVVPTLVAGAAVVFRGPDVWDERELTEVCERAGVTVAPLPTGYWHSISSSPPGAVRRPSRLRLVNVLGDAMLVEPVRRWREGPLGAVPLVNTYGPTEVTITSTLYDVPPDFGRRDEDRDVTSVPIGPPIAHRQVYVLDEEGRPVPDGEVGELYIGGPCVARGYHRRPALTAERFVPDPFGDVPGARLYRTGDLGVRRPGGVLDFLGRVDNQVKIRGFRVEAGEIEAALVEHPSVLEAAVVARPRPQGDKELVAYVVRDDGPEGEDLPTFLRRRLPDYMVPAVVVALESLPLSAAGKVDRAALLARADVRQEAERPYVPPRTPHEAVVAETWAEVLGLERVGSEDDFFALGGDSLLATRVASRLRHATGADVTPRALFERRTVRALAELVAAGGSASRAPALVPAPDREAPPISFAQARLWFLDQLDPGNPRYNEALALRLHGPLDRRALRQTLDELARRHDVLRAVFRSIDGRPVQRIQPPFPVPLAEHDLTATPAEEREAELRRRLVAESERPFDLGRGPLVRAALVALSADEHVLVLGMHHTVCDGWSMEVLLRELAAIYEALAAGAPSPLPAAGLQYGDYAAWQRRWLTDDELGAQLAYWKDRLSGELPVLELPTDRPRPAVPRYRGGRVSRTLDPDLATAVEDLARVEGATTAMALVAAFQALLARHAGQDEVLVGLAVAGRTRPELEELVGFFVNTLVVRTDLSGEPGFRELLARVRAASLEALANQDLPFERLVDELQPDRELARNPLFQVMVAPAHAPLGSVRIGDLELEPFELENETAKFDLTLVPSSEQGRLRLTLEYDGDLFDRSTAERLLARLERLLQAVCAEPEAPLPDLELLPDEERALLGSSSRRRASFRCDGTLGSLFGERAAAAPERIALSFGEEQTSYGELEARSNRLAHELVARGVGPDDLVGVFLERTPDLLVGLLGILKAGAGYLPLDPANPEERLAFMLEDSGSRLLVTEEALAGRLPPGAPPTLVLEREAERLAARPAEPPVDRARPGNLAYSIYTSGSTGRPKGVGITHENVVRLMRSTEHWYEFGPEDVWTLFHSYAFDMSVWEIWGAFLYGGRLVVVPYLVSRAPAEFWRLLREERVTALNQTPSAFRPLVDEAVRDPVDTTLRFVSFGGEALDPRVLRPWLERYPDRPRLVNMYGITETTVHATYRPVTLADADSAGSPIGVAIPDLEVHVLDDRLRPAPVGVPGELHVGGAGLARGYLGRPALTAERFVPAPSGPPGARLYRSGDLARRRANGELEYLGRADQQVKIRGFRIELGEIEAALSSHPQVRECAVVCRGEGDAKRLHAYLVADGGSPPPERLRAHLRQTLPEHMVPATFQTLPALPLTPNGKLDRKRLPEPDQARPELEASYRPPRGEVERILAALWGELLGLERVGIDDNFFALGGDSILSLQILARAAQAGIKLSPRQVFQHQTIAELAAVAELAERARDAERPVVGPAPLSPIQRWFFDPEPADPHHYNQAVLVGAAEPLDANRLQEAWALLHAHHDQLRAVYRRVGERWEQTILPPERVTVPPPERDAGEGAPARLQASLRLDEPPLTRMLLAGDDEVLLVCHHLNVDAVSWRVLLEDLEAAYRALRDREPVRLPAKTSSYGAWTRRLAEHAATPRAAAEVEHWAATLDPLPEPLPRDFPAGGDEDVCGAAAGGDEDVCGAAAVVEAQLGLEETRALLRDAPQAYGTRITEVLLAALARSVCEWTGAPDVLVDLEGHGRDVFDDLDVSRTVGWFTAIFPVRLDGRPASPGEQLIRAKETLRRVPNGGLGFGLLRSHGPDEVRRRLAQAPAPEIVFNYLGQVDRLPLELLSLVDGGAAPGPDESPRNRRRHALEVEGVVVGGRLRTTWTYSERVHRRSTVAALADSFLATLRELVAHCLEPDAGASSPSDFPLADLEERDLAQLASLLSDS